MRVFRGREETVPADRERTHEIVDRASEAGQPVLRVWTPPRQVAFGRRDARADGYDRARRFAERRGFPTVERAVGGRAVAFTGSTVAFVYADPDADRTAIQSRYEWATHRLQDALGSVGVDAREGEPDASFCPGTHSLQADGKLVGLAQRVRSDLAFTSGVVVVRDREVIGEVLSPVYDALGVPFEPETVGSVARAGGPASPDAVCDALVDAFQLRET